MIFLMSQNAADRHQVKPGIVQCISTSLNPAHVLPPPRRRLEALQGDVERDLVDGQSGGPCDRVEARPRYLRVKRKRSSICSSTEFTWSM